MKNANRIFFALILSLSFVGAAEAAAVSTPNAVSSGIAHSVRAKKQRKKHKPRKQHAAKKKKNKHSRA